LLDILVIEHGIVEFDSRQEHGLVDLAEDGHVVGDLDTLVGVEAGEVVLVAFGKRVDKLGGGASYQGGGGRGGGGGRRY
jgi:hypothetical protein